MKNVTAALFVALTLGLAVGAPAKSQDPPQEPLPVRCPGVGDFCGMDGGCEPKEDGGVRCVFDYYYFTVEE